MLRPLRLWTGLITAALLLGSCQGGPESELIFRELTPEEEVLSEAANEFSFELFRAAVASSDGGNVFLSPLSASFALAMTYNGAGTTTHAEMAAVLGLDPLTLDQANEAYRGLMEQLTHLDRRVQLEIANSIWYRDDFLVEDDFLARNEEYFSAQVEALDFAAPDAADTINEWVSEATHGKITELAPNSIPPDAVMYLMNAIYFKGDWASRFEPDNTHPAPFHLLDGTLREVPLMQQVAELDYLHGDWFQAVDLAFGEGHFRMTVVLPLPDVPLNEVVDGLTAQSWSTWRDRFSPAQVDLALPRFELEYELELNQALSDLGMPSAFTPGAADFSGINAELDLYISKVKQKTYLKVHEEGAEAAAATSVEVVFTSIPLVHEMRVDRPFLVILHDRHTGTVLFVGKIVDPPTD